jgi:hypothetical protein
MNYLHVVLVSLVVLTAAPSFADKVDKTQKRVDKCIAQLSDAKPKNRLKALKELEQLGPAAERALPAVVLAAEDINPEVSARAAELIRRLGPQALGRAASAATDAAVRARMLERIADPAVLSDLVRTGSEDLRREALARIVDEAVLLELARSGPAETRAQVLEKIQDPVSLAELARSGPEDVRLAAVGRIQDTSILLALARTGPPEVQLVAMSAITDPALIAGLLVDAPENVRLAALDWLGKRVISGPSLEDRLGALEHIDDPARLIELCAAAPADTVPGIVAKIGDPATLASLTLHERPEVAQAAVALVSDPAVLAAAAKHPNASVRLQAVRRLKGDKILGGIALRDESAEVRLAALTRISGQNLLIDIAAKDKEPAIRRVAADLALKKNRGKVPVVAILGVHQEGYGALIRQKLDTSLRGKAMTFACARDWNCSFFGSQIRIEVNVSDSDQCFDKIYLGSSCSLRGKVVSITLTYLKGEQTLVQHQVAAQTPDVISYTVHNFNDMGPGLGDVQRETSAVVTEKIKELSVDFSGAPLAAMLEL